MLGTQLIKKYKTNLKFLAKNLAVDLYYLKIQD